MYAIYLVKSTVQKLVTRIINWFKSKDELGVFDYNRTPNNPLCIPALRGVRHLGQISDIPLPVIPYTLHPLILLTFHFNYILKTCL